MLQLEESAAKPNVSRKTLSAEGIDTAITYRFLAICFLDKAYVAKMKQIIFPRRSDFVIQTLMDWKKTSTAYARMAIDQRVPKLFWVRPKSELGEHPATKFVFNISNVLFSQVPAVKTDTDKQWQRWKCATQGWTAWSPPFWLFTSLVWISTPTLGNTWLDQLKKRCVNCGNTYFLTWVQSLGANRLCLRFRK